MFRVSLTEENIKLNQHFWQPSAGKEVLGNHNCWDDLQTIYCSVHIDITIVLFFKHYAWFSDVAALLMIIIDIVCDK